MVGSARIADTGTCDNVPMSERASGWYPDPNDPDTLRYWDGILWTDRTMPRLKPGLDQSTIGAPRPVEQHPHPHQHVPYPGQHPAMQTRPALAITPDGQQLSGWWRRAFALIIDNVITFVVAIPLSWAWLSDWVDVYRTFISDTMDASRTGGKTPSVPSALFDFPWQVGLVAVAVYFVYEVTLTTWRGQTVGKMITGIKVRQVEQDKPPTPVTSIYRFLIKQLSSIVGSVPLLSFLVAVFQLVDYLRPLGDRMKQSFHDAWPGTYVVRATKQKAVPPAPQMPPNQQQGPYQGPYQR